MDANSIAAIGDACYVLLALILVVAGAAKVLDGHAARTIESVALGDVVPTRHRGGVWRLLGLIEICAALVAASVLSLPRVSVVVLCMLAVAYSLWAWHWRPRRPCGCFGSASREAAGPRSVARAASLLVFAAVGLGSHAPLWEAVLDSSFWMTLGIASLLFIALSPELRVPTPRASACLRGHAADRRVALALPASQAWHRLAAVITERNPSATWHASCVAFVAFPAEVAGQSAFAVFAVGLRGTDDGIRGALVDSRGDMLESATVLIGGTV
jgi:hypothetical protein